MKMKNLLIEETIPERSFFKPQEVSALLKVKPHEIRYWESEFSGFKGHKTKHGLKLYRREEVLLLAGIRHLLHEKKFTIAAAKQILKDAQDFSEDVQKSPAIEAKAAIEPLADETVLEISANEPLGELSNESLAVLSNQILHEASEILIKTEGEYNEKTHAIYEDLGSEETIALVEEVVIDDPIPQSVPYVVQEQKIMPPVVPSTLSLEDRTRVASANTLKASKESLENLLSSLDRFKEGSFWEGTFLKR